MESRIDLDVLANRVTQVVLGLMEERLSDLTRRGRWVTLREASELKGICLKTLQNRRALQPNKGQEEGIVGGKRRWTRETVEAWLNQTDAELGGAR